MRRCLCIMLVLACCIVTTVGSFADSGVKTVNSYGDSLGKIYIHVENEDEAKNIISEINKHNEDVMHKYKNAITTGKSQNPNYSYEERIMEENDKSQINVTSAMKTSDDTTQKVTYNYVASDNLHCYINYTTKVNKYGATVFDRIIGKHLYCEEASTVRNVDYGSARYLENGRTYAFTYSCTVVLKWTTGSTSSSAEVKASQYCEFYSSGRCYPN